jgi:hypothetical protein
MEKEGEIWIFGLMVAAIVAAGAWYTTHLIAVGRDEDKARNAALTLAQQRRADAQTAALTATVQQGLTAHAKELADIAVNQLSLPPISVSRITIAAASAVSGHPDASPSRSAAPGAAIVPSSVLCESSDVLRSGYIEAGRADVMTADYRLLYSTWPQISSVPR